MSHPIGFVQAPTAALPADVQDRRLTNWAGWYGLLALTLIGVIAVIDRQVFVLAAGPIKQSLRLSDFQLGALQGLGVALFTAVATYPFGWLADRIDRRLVLVLGILIWSAALVGSAMASSFAGLFFWASLVAGGESAGSPVAASLVVEWFSGRARLLANSLAVISGKLGASLALVLCGYLIAFSDSVRPQLPAFMIGLETWRISMLLAACGAPLLLMLTMSLPHGRRPAAVAAEGMRAAADRGTKGEVLAFLKAHPRLFITFYCGIGFVVLGFSALGTWLPIVFSRMFQATPVQVGNAFGLASTVSIITGLAFMALAPRWVVPRLGVRTPILILMGVSWLVIVPTALMLLASSFNMLFVLTTTFVSITTWGSMTIVTALMDMAPRRLVGRLVAISVVTQAGFGAVAPPLVGWLSDRIPGETGLLQAMVAVAVTGFALSGWVLWLCSREYAAGVMAARAFDAR